VNQAREAAGRRAANSLWFWGAGRLEGNLVAPCAVVQATDPLARGFCRAAGVSAGAPDLAAALGHDTLVVLDALHGPAMQLDLDAWRAGLAVLERDWFAPLADALQRGRPGALTLSAPGDRSSLELVVHARDRWKIWRRPLPFDALLKSLMPTAAPLPGGSAPPQHEPRQP
jgi:hypothetical protein